MWYSFRDEDGNEVDFERMSVLLNNSIGRSLYVPIMKLDDCLYVGSYYSFLPGRCSWTYMGKTREASQRWYKRYVDWQIEKALGLEFDSADEA